MTDKDQTTDDGRQITEIRDQSLRGQRLRRKGTQFGPTVELIVDLSPRRFWKMGLN